MANMDDIGHQMGAKRGHEVFLQSIGRSGRYKFVCINCQQSFNYYEGEFFGWALNNDCPKKEKNKT